MTVLGIDTTGLPVSAAIMREGVIAGSIYLNIEKKHAETLMPAIDALLKTLGIEIDEIEALAVSSGPGSFTGIRIGVACAEGMARGLNIPAYGVNTLDALLMNITSNGVKCSLMDARRQEVYVKAVKDGEVIIEGSVLPLNEVLERLSKFKTVTFNGDGALTYRDILLREMPECIIANGQFCLQNACSVLECFVKGLAKPAENGVIYPEYYRLSQAERLKMEKSEAND